MKYKVTLISQTPIFDGKTRESIDVEAENENEAKRRGHTLIAMKIGKTYPIFGVTVHVQID